jgi:fermentation-respiration switch protein FrsA (DUF1100 family)
MLLGVIVICYLAFVIFALLCADGMIHHPELTSRRVVEGQQKIKGPDGTTIAVLHLPNPSARFTVWFFHGNAEDLGNVEPLLRQIRDAGFAVFAADYPGYGHSDGRPTEASFYASSRAARDYLRNTLRVPPERTLLYGRSLGSGPAVQMATEERVGGLVIQSGFMSAFRVLTRWRLLPWDQFNNLAKLPQVSCPVLVMHGQADEVISFAHAEALFAAAAGPKQHLWVPRAGHNSAVDSAGETYWRSLRDFSDLCVRSGASP